MAKKPDMAVVLDGPDDEEAPEDGGDDEAAIHDAGKAALAAFSSGDPVAIAKAIAACARAVPEDDEAEGEGAPPLAG